MVQKDVEDSDRLRAQIGVSIGLARSVVAKWLPAQTDAEKKAEYEHSGATSDAAVLVNRRAPRAGLGATGENDPAATMSVEDLKIRRRLQQKTKKLDEQKREMMAQKQARRVMVSDDDEEDSRSSLKKGQKKQKVAQMDSLDHYTKTSKRKGFGR